jgi:hypothetical protein
MSIAEREKLLIEKSDFLSKQSVRIRGERWDKSSMIGNGAIGASPSDDGTITKIVHFQRHGHGYHNLLGDILRDAGIKPDIDSRDLTINPWIRPDIVDAPLTETGKWQCEQQRCLASSLHPELVVISPLTRTIQTAKISYADFCDSAISIPWIAHEACREETGVLAYPHTI